jgi:hypothetical protein
MPPPTTPHVSLDSPDPLPSPTQTEPSRCLQPSMNKAEWPYDSMALPVWKHESNGCPRRSGMQVKQRPHRIPRNLSRRHPTAEYTPNLYEALQDIRLNSDERHTEFLTPHPTDLRLLDKQLRVGIVREDVQFKIISRFDRIHAHNSAASRRKVLHQTLTRHFLPVAGEAASKLRSEPAMFS